MRGSRECGSTKTAGTAAKTSSISFRDTPCWPHYGQFPDPSRNRRFSPWQPIRLCRHLQYVGVSRPALPGQRWSQIRPARAGRSAGATGAPMPVAPVPTDAARPVGQREPAEHGIGAGYLCEVATNGRLYRRDGRHGVGMGLDRDLDCGCGRVLGGVGRTARHRFDPERNGPRSRRHAAGFDVRVRRHPRRGGTGARSDRSQHRCHGFAARPSASARARDPPASLNHWCSSRAADRCPRHLRSSALRPYSAIALARRPARPLGPHT